MVKVTFDMENPPYLSFDFDGLIEKVKQYLPPMVLPHILARCSVVVPLPLTANALAQVLAIYDALIALKDAIVTALTEVRIQPSSAITVSRKSHGMLRLTNRDSGAQLPTIVAGLADLATQCEVRRDPQAPHRPSLRSSEFQFVATWSLTVDLHGHLAGGRSSLTKCKRMPKMLASHRLRSQARCAPKHQRVERRTVAP